MEFIDSHCHPHFDNYDQDREEVLARSSEAGVKRIIAVGCSLVDSQKAVDFAQRHRGVWATVGSHPHDGKEFLANKDAAEELKKLAGMPKVVGVGEIGLDYYHQHTSKIDQEKMLRTQLEVGLEISLPFVFHVREAFTDFWKIFDSYSGVNQPIKGVIHSFSAAPDILDQVLQRELFVGLNGLLTYTKQDSWRESAKLIPLNKVLLETDAPFLTPIPERGKRCEPKHTLTTAQFLANLRKEDLAELAAQTTDNVVKLFKLTEEKI